jgi:hypothetical protein
VKCYGKIQVIANEPAQTTRELENQRPSSTLTDHA